MRRARGAASVAIAGLVLLVRGPAIADAGSAPAALKLCDGVDRRSRPNCELVVGFYEAFFNGHDMSAANRALDATYVQHNPDTPDGRQALIDFFAGYFREHPRAHSQILRVAAGGDLVWLHVHDSDGDGGRGDAVVDIFRVKNRRIVEHWDVIQPVPEPSANRNTMF